MSGYRASGHGNNGRIITRGRALLTVLIAMLVPPVIRWVEPVVPVNAAAPVHPNLGGMIGASNLLVAALSR